MAAPFSRVLSKTDDAIVAYLISQNAGTAADVFPAKKSAKKTAPCTIVFSSEAREEIAFSGRYKVKTAIMVKSIAIDESTEVAGTQKTAHDARVANTNDPAKNGPIGDSETLANAINAAVAAALLTDYTVFGVVEESQTAGFEEDCWVETINVEITCCCSTVA